MAQKCYFSYDWQNKPEITTIMRLFKKAIERDSYNKIQVIWDEDFHNGENFKEKEKIIRECDSVIIFATTEYKRSVDESDETRGVCREYKQILEARNSNNIKVLSVLISGTISSAITREFRDDIAADFSNHKLYYNNKKGRSFVAKDCRQDFSNLIIDIIYETEQSARRKEYHFASQEEAYRTMFVETEDKHRLPKEAMYQLDIYEDIFTGISSGIVVGRKGSGKTTLFSVLENYDRIRFDKHFKILRPISAEHINESYIYNVYQSFIEDDITLGRDDILSLFWKIYLTMCTIYIVCIEEENNRIRDERRQDFHNASVKLRKELNVNVLDSQNVSKAIFSKSIDLWSNYIKNDVINYSTETSFIPSIVANLTVDRVMQSFWGKRLYKKLVNGISMCEKNIVLALDNFNAVSDDFRRAAKADIKSGIEASIVMGIDKVDFDGMLYRTLVTTIDELKSNDIGIMERVTFCIIIPQDRVDQICLVDRDYSKRHFYHLSWDAMELLSLILLRFKILFNFELDLSQEQDLEKTFKWAMNKYLPSIPTEVEIDVGNGVIRKMELYQYILRNSFWRPRDIIKHFSVLIDANEKAQKRSTCIDNVTLKDLLYKVTDDIITSEFYFEYDKVIYNISDFLYRFRNQEIIMSVEKVVEIIQAFKFEGALFFDKSNVLTTIEMLYEIGVLGLMFNNDYRKQNNINIKLCFAFTEGMYPFSVVRDSLLTNQQDLKFVINPIFQKKYSLAFPTSELIADFSWEYLKNNHLRKSVIDRP